MRTHYRNGDEIGRPAPPGLVGSGGVGRGVRGGEYGGRNFGAEKRPPAPLARAAVSTEYTAAMAAETISSDFSALASYVTVTPKLPSPPGRPRPGRDNRSTGRVGPGVFRVWTI